MISRTPSSLLWRTWLKTSAKRPHKTVLTETGSGESFTALQITQKAEALAESFGNHLQRRIIAISLPNGIEWVTTFLAIQKLNAVSLLMDHTLSEEAQFATARNLGAHYLYQKGKLLPVSKIKSPPKQISCIKVTSGTTGQLKPVPVTSEELLADGQQIIDTMKIRPSDRSLALIPLGHAYGLGNLFLPLLIQGTALTCSREFVPRQIISFIHIHKITIFPGVPSLYRVLVEMEPASLSPLRLAISAGAFLPNDLARRFFEKYKVKIHNFYGSTETGAISYDRTGEATLAGRSVGKPMLRVKTQIDRNGQIIAIGKSVAKSQCKKKSFFTLPDLGKIDFKGELVLLGRVGSIANIGGKKVHPAEVESNLRKTDHVSDAWVTVLQDQRGNDYLAAAVETSKTIQEIEQSMNRVLPSWKFPKRYYIQRSLPRTIRGKLNTSLLRTILQDSLPFA